MEIVRNLKFHPYVDSVWSWSEKNMKKEQLGRPRRELMGYEMSFSAIYWNAQHGAPKKNAPATKGQAFMWQDFFLTYHRA